MYYAEEVVNQLKTSRQLAVFGAGVMALGVVNCLTAPPYNLSIRCCLVSHKTGNPSQVSGIPVLDFTEAEKILAQDALIVIAAVDKNLDSMEESLHRHGYFHTIPLTYEGDLWCLIRGNLYREERLAQGKSYLVLEEELGKIDGSVSEGMPQKARTVSLYTARCHVDRTLKEDITRYSWEIPIQVGAALTDQRICDVCDNTGDNISHKNRQYCELTALYWIWKHDVSDYVGLGHYRRHFDVDGESLGKLACSDIDAVFTIPIFDFPSVGEVYVRDHVEGDWLVMLEAIERLCPEYMAAAKELEAGRFYYAYNMFLMKREILDRYCSWLFPILFYCEKRCGEERNRVEHGKRSVYQERYLGFLAEHLMSVYFLYHEKEYKIVHGGKHFIGG